MRHIVFLTMVVLLAGIATAGYACNGQGGGGTSAAGMMGLSSLRGGTTGLTSSGSFAPSSVAVQQAMLRQQLAYQQALQQQYQHQLLAQQQMLQDQGNEPTLTRAERIQQVREQRLAQRKARAAALLAKKEAAKARNLVRQQKLQSQDATQQLATNP